MIKTLTTPDKLRLTATNFDNVNLSPEADGNRAAKINVKKLDIELNNVTIAVSFGCRANWYK